MRDEKTSKEDVPDLVMIAKDCTGGQISIQK
jgi:hypothetical protein